MRNTNEAVGQALGLSHSGVSRIRSGTRIPLMATMERIEKVLGWPIGLQAAAASRGTYAVEFERRIEASAEADDEAASQAVSG